MMLRRLRWVLAILVGLASLLLPACGEEKPQARGESAARPEAGQQAHPRAPATAQKPVSAPGPARRHPFAPMRTAAPRLAVATRLGPLALTGMYENNGVPTAIIQEGRRVHFVTEGDEIGGLRVLSIRDDEVVLGEGRRRRVLSLYDGELASGG